MSNKESTMCLECSAHLPVKTPTCLHLFEAVIVRLSNQPALRCELRMAMDAYALQHVEQFCPHQRSVAIHLMGLCWGLEFQGDVKVARAMQRWLENHAELPQILPPFVSPFEEFLTISDVWHELQRLPAEPEEQDWLVFEHPVRRWAHSVWFVWKEQHENVRKWIAKSISQDNK